MWDAGREIPEIAFEDVADKAAAFDVDGSDPCGAVEHDRPFRGLVPVQFADTYGLEPHIHARQLLGNGKLAGRDFARPAALINPLVGKRERVLEHRHAADVGKRWYAGVRISIIEGWIHRTRSGDRIRPARPHA